MATLFFVGSFLGITCAVYFTLTRLDWWWRRRQVLARLQRAINP